MKDFMCDIIFRFDNIWGGPKIRHKIFKNLETYYFFCFILLKTSL